VSGVFARSGNRCVIEVVVRNEGTCAGGCIVGNDSNFADWSGVFVVTRMTCNKFARVNESLATCWKMARCFESPGEGWGHFTVVRKYIKEKRIHSAGTDLDWWCGNKTTGKGIKIAGGDWEEWRGNLITGKGVESTWAGIVRVVR
jgi:hypothetical protein